MSEFLDQPTDGPRKPGDNPNTLNARRRKNARPKTTNTTSTSEHNKNMKFSWIDPLPQVDVIYPIGLDPQPASFPAGHVELRFDLPSVIADPFIQQFESVGDRTLLHEEIIKTGKKKMESQAYFKSARQLYSTMLDHEKSQNQPLKAVYYDETAIPSHMSAAIGIIGHMETKVGKVLVKHASTLFKRWIAKGLQIDPDASQIDTVSADTLVWGDSDSRELAYELARKKIEDITNDVYTITVDNVTHHVSMPKLHNHNLDDYYAMISDQVPDATMLRGLVSLLNTSQNQWNNNIIGNGFNFDDVLNHLNLTYAPEEYSVRVMREQFENCMSCYITGVRVHIESLLHVSPPPAGSNGYGAQLVKSNGIQANWEFPISDADAAMGFMFSPNESFTLTPKIVAYSRRDKNTVMSNFASRDGKSVAQ